MYGVDYRTPEETKRFNNAVEHELHMKECRDEYWGRMNEPKPPLDEQGHIWIDTKGPVVSPVETCRIISPPSYAGQYKLGKGIGVSFSAENKPSFIKRFLMKHLLGFYWEDNK